MKDDEILGVLQAIKGQLWVVIFALGLIIGGLLKLV
jgi:hypothetical protein